VKLLIQTGCQGWLKAVQLIGPRGSFRSTMPLFPPEFAPRLSRPKKFCPQLGV